VARSDARQRLNAAVAERDATRAAAEVADADLRHAIKDAVTAGVTITEVAELTGYHRNSIRRIVDES
jgi:hypothetical protein